jgi:hypothetical protein
LSTGILAFGSVGSFLKPRQMMIDTKRIDKKRYFITVRIWAFKHGQDYKSAHAWVFVQSKVNIKLLSLLDEQGNWRFFR